MLARAEMLSVGGQRPDGGGDERADPRDRHRSLSRIVRLGSGGDLDARRSLRSSGSRSASTRTIKQGRAGSGRPLAEASVCAISRSMWPWPHGAITPYPTIVYPRAVNQLSALADQHVPSAEHNRQRPLRFHLQRHEPHGRTLRRFAGRLRLAASILCPLARSIGRPERSASLTAQLLKLSSQVMVADAGCNRHHARSPPPHWKRPPSYSHYA